jgi:hypothetical protein
MLKKELTLRDLEVINFFFYFRREEPISFPDALLKHAIIGEDNISTPGRL